MPLFDTVNFNRHKTRGFAPELLQSCALAVQLRGLGRGCKHIGITSASGQTKPLG